MRDAFLAAVTAANMMDLAVIIVPVCVSVIMSLRVYNSQLELKESYANHMESATNLISDLLGVPTEATEARSTAYELATLLASSCTLVNLLSVLSETMKTARDHLQLSPGKVMQLASIMRAAHSFVPYVVYGSKMNATELKALCGVVCACCHIPRVDCILPEAQMSHILCGLSELFEALPFTACEANPELLLALILPVASELIR